MVFIENKYTRIYYTIIEKAKSRNVSDYTENHHIIPKSLGGTNNKDNLVKLTAREHFVCHLLLTKMTIGESRNKMISAVFYLTGRGKAERKNIIKSSRLYEKLKIEHAQYVSNQKKGCRQPPRTTETKNRLSKSKTGRLNPNYRYNYTTPWGVFESSGLASKSCPEYITANSIRNFCTTKNDVPISSLSVCRSKGYLKTEHIGKTPNQLGFSINNTI